MGHTGRGPIGSSDGPFLHVYGKSWRVDTDDLMLRDRLACVRRSSAIVKHCYEEFPENELQALMLAVLELHAANEQLLEKLITER